MFGWQKKKVAPQISLLRISWLIINKIVGSKGRFTVGLLINEWSYSKMIFTMIRTTVVLINHSSMKTFFQFSFSISAR